jgi:hypothetical protein
MKDVPLSVRERVGGVKMVSQHVHWDDASMNCFAFCILVWTE